MVICETLIAVLFRVRNFQIFLFHISQSGIETLIFFILTPLRPRCQDEARLRHSAL
jgi:hypothetical protein